MSLALAITAVWLLDAGLWWLNGDRGIAGVAVAIAFLPVILTAYLRRLGHAEAARVYLAQQAARGISPTEARDRVHELASDGVTFDTDDVPSWPVNVVLLLGLGGVIALVVAVIALV